jgi:hypothetical protein
MKQAAWFKYYKDEVELATILTDESLDKLIKKALARAALMDDDNASSELINELGDFILMYEDNNILESSIRLLELGAKFPGRTTWVIANVEDYCYIFACDTVKEAEARVRAKLKK